MTPEEIIAAQHRCDNATPGPWIPFQPADSNGDENFEWWWVWRQDKLPYYGGIIHLDEYQNGQNVTIPGAIGSIETTDTGLFGRIEQDAADAEFIAHARQDLPNALNHIKELEQQLAEKEAELATLRGASLPDEPCPTVEPHHINLHGMHGH